MKRSGLVAAATAAALAVPVGASAHPTEIGQGAFSSALPEIELLAPQAAQPVPQSAPPAEFDMTDNMRFEGFSPRPAAGSLSLANSDIAFQGGNVYQGTFHGFRIIDVGDPSRPREVINYSDCRHPAGQGDVTVYKDVLTRSWDSASANGMPEGGWPCGDTVVPAGGEGLHVFDISDPRRPKVMAFIDLPCGSHTATAVPDPENDRLIVYSSPSNGACDGFDVLEIPLKNPAAASYHHFELSVDLIHCHDTGVILGNALRVACAGGQGFAVWSMNPVDGGSKLDPQLLYTKNLKQELGININTGHSAAFSNNGRTLIFGHEPDGGTQARCQETGTPLHANNNPAIPNPVYPNQTDDMKSLFFFDTLTGEKKGQWTLPRPQSRYENCTVHNYNVVPTPQRDILVHGSYQSGIGVVDFTNLDDIREVAYADPKPLNPDALTAGGDWSSHYYNGRIYQSDITRGLLVWRFGGNEFDGAQRLKRLNPQTQEYTTS